MPKTKKLRSEILEIARGYKASGTSNKAIIKSLIDDLGMSKRKASRIVRDL